MDVILNGQYNMQKTAENIKNILILFNKRYHINKFREIHLSLTFVNDDGDDVELVDTETNQVYRFLEIYQQQPILHKRYHTPAGLQLVINNTANITKNNRTKK